VLQVKMGKGERVESVKEAFIPPHLEKELLEL
jgi:hypothetical protein